MWSFDCLWNIASSVEEDSKNVQPEGVQCFLINKEKGGKVKYAFTFGMVDYSGIFDFESRVSFIGGDLQDNCFELINKLGWIEEFEAFKQETMNSDHPLAKLITNDESFWVYVDQIFYDICFQKVLWLNY